MAQWVRKKLSQYYYSTNLNSPNSKADEFEKIAKRNNVDLSRDLLDKIISDKCENQDLIEFYDKFRKNPDIIFNIHQY